MYIQIYRNINWILCRKLSMLVALVELAVINFFVLRDLGIFWKNTYPKRTGIRQTNFAFTKVTEHSTRPVSFLISPAYFRGSLDHTINKKIQGTLGYVILFGRAVCKILWNFNVSFFYRKFKWIEKYKLIFIQTDLESQLNWILSPNSFEKQNLVVSTLMGQVQVGNK